MIWGGKPLSLVQHPFQASNLETQPLQLEERLGFKNLEKTSGGVAEIRPFPALIFLGL